jgi:amino acid permease
LIKGKLPIHQQMEKPHPTGSFSSQGTESSDVPLLHHEGSLNAYYPEEGDFRKSSSFIQFFFKSFSGGSLTVGILSLIAATIGTGGLMISQAMAASGVIWSVVQVLICSWMSYVTLIALVKCANDTNSRSYQEVVAVTFGGWFKHVFNFCCFFANWGSAIIYLQQSSELLATVAKAYGGDSLPAWLTSPDSQLLSVILATVFMLPLALPRELSGLKYFTFANLLIILLMCYAVIYEGFAYEPIAKSFSTTSMFTLGGFTTTFPTIIFSVTSHPNVIDVFIELKSPTLKKMKTVIIWTMIFTIVSYTIVGILGFATFSANIDILNDQNYANGVILVAYGYTIQGIQTVYPTLIMISMMTTCFSILISQSFNLKPAKDSLRSSMRTLLKKVKLTESDSENDPETMVEQFIYVSITLYSCVLVALFSDSIQVIMNILGSSFFSLLCFIFPSMLYLKVYGTGDGTLSKKDKALHWFLIGVNSIFTVWNTTANVLAI